MNDWNANLYRKFEKERTLPSKDLIARISLSSPCRILDLGCGPGNSTRELVARWPDAEVVGMDSSPDMLAKAHDSLPGVKWIQADATSDLNTLGTFDLVFSNAALQWMPFHETLLPRLMGLVADGGVFAVQVPNTLTMKISSALENTVSSPVWAPYFNHFVNGQTYHEPSFYYDVLSGVSSGVSLWETWYHHVMDSPSAIVDWYESTGLRPYLSLLDSDEKRCAFKADFLKNVEKLYPPQRDGSVLFPFRRIFMIAQK